jgi:hypothetical protein
MAQVAIQLTVGQPMHVTLDEHQLQTLVGWFNGAPAESVHGVQVPGIGEVRMQKRHVVRLVLS